MVFPTGVLTDYLRFDWYVAGEIRKECDVGNTRRKQQAKGHPWWRAGCPRASTSTPASTCNHHRQCERACTAHGRHNAPLARSHRKHLSHGSHEDIAWLNHWVASIRQSPDSRTQRGRVCRYVRTDACLWPVRSAYANGEDSPTRNSAANRPPRHSKIESFLAVHIFADGRS